MNHCDFIKKGLRIGDKDFDLIDVPGDGNCLFYSILASGKFEQHNNNHLSLRASIAKFVLEEVQKTASMKF